MIYQVLARKWRPKKFSELMGQEHVVRALTSSLEQGRLHHAFLFTGTRGVGKTTIARIIAKALNCEVGLGAEPCGQCSSCLDIDQGRYPDLLEIDAASRTKVDDTREILDNILYAPARGRFKVYLIDEVHMLSLSSFNALLKTLEEPPEHVKFILATTDPQKLPVTVLSRCLKFHLKRLTPSQIGDQITRILEAENIFAEAEAIAEIARAADGSMRDGLSLLDQAIAFGQGKLDADSTRDMLGTVSRETVFDLLESIADADAHRVIEKLAELNTFGGNHGQILMRMSECFHTLAFLQIVGPEPGSDAQISLEPHPRLVALIERFESATLQVNFQLALLGARDVQQAFDPRLAFEMCVLRMLSFAPIDPAQIPPRGKSEPAKGASESGKTSARASAPLSSENSAKPTVRASADIAPTRAVQPRSELEPARGVEAMPVEANHSEQVRVAASVLASVEADSEKELPAALTELLALIANLPIKGPARELAFNCAVIGVEAGQLRLKLDPAYSILLSSENQNQIQQAWSALQRHERWHIELAESSKPTAAQWLARQQQQKQNDFEQSVRSHPLVLSLQSELGASIREGSIRLH